MQRTGRRREEGFSLVELMVVVIVLGILAATIIPQFASTTDDTKIGVARGHIAEYSGHLERFRLHMERYPTTDEGLRALVEEPADSNGRWRGPYVQQLRDDPWGKPYRYVHPGTHGIAYDLWSTGADELDGGDGAAADISNWEKRN